ncbi:MAG: MogA/MoaB family molybdenum cofactor biosynthesis protein [Acidimicrobiales bacterium]
MAEIPSDRPSPGPAQAVAPKAVAPHAAATQAPAPQAKVLTVSDGVVAGTRSDRSGPALIASLTRHGFEVVEARVVIDGVEEVAAAIVGLAQNFAGLLVTTGGTGFGPRDLTPEATLAVLDRRADGMAEAMRAVNPRLGRLSRGVVGTVGRCLVVNTPGSERGSVECLESVIDAVPHALSLMAGLDTAHPVVEPSRG